MSRTARTRGRTAVTTAVVTAVSVLTLSSCSALSGLGAPELSDSDVITLGTAHAGMFGFFGTSTTEVTGRSVSVQYVLPDETELYTLTTDLDPTDREGVEEAAARYVAWEGRPWRDDSVVCTDLPATSVRITGSLSHSSSVQDCDEDAPLRTLTNRVDDVEPEQLVEVAHPLDDWSIEITQAPAADEPGAAERYVLLPAEHEVGMLLEDAEGSYSGEPLGWETTGDVLRGMNDLLLAGDEPDCAEPLGEMTLVEGDGEEQQRTVPLCSGTPTEELAEMLRAL